MAAQLQSNPIAKKSLKVAAAPAAPAAKAVKPAAAAAPERLVDVASFRNLPLAGAPKVSAKVDPTLGKTGVDAFVLDKLENAGGLGTMAANGIRLFTRVVGPIAYAVSTVRNFNSLQKALKDPTISGGSKAVLAVGTVGTGIAAAAAAVAAAPLKLFGKLGLSVAGQVKANKISGVAGGLAGVLYATINMVETLRNPQAKPAERAFSKLGFGMGALGFLFGSAAMVLSMTGAAPGLLALSSQVATGAGIFGLATWIGQMFLGKNEWLNEKLKGSAIA